MRVLRTVRERLERRFGDPPDWLLVLGSGLGPLREAIEGAEAAPYPELGLPPTSVDGHAGELVVGSLGGRRVACFAGRLHAYEGLPLPELVRGLRAALLWAPSARVLLTAAVGSIRPELPVGTLFLVRDHVNLTGRNVLLGPNLEELGPRFPDLSDLYTAELRARVRKRAAELGIPLVEGVYGAVLGPSYETPAEVRALGLLGADMVGMSLVHEAIAAAHMGAPVLALAVASNLAAGLSTRPITHEEVGQAVRSAAANLRRLVGAVVAEEDAEAPARGAGAT